MSPEDAKKAKKFCEKMVLSGLTLPKYCERENIKLATGKRWRDAEYRRKIKEQMAVKKE